MSCNSQNCEHKAEFGLLTQQATKCKEHVETNMIISPFQKCNYLNCSDFSSYGSFKDQLPIFCKNHITDDSVSLLYKLCSNCKKVRNDFNQENDKLCTECKDDSFEITLNFIQQHFTVKLHRKQFPSFILFETQTDTFAIVMPKKSQKYNPKLIKEESQMIEIIKQQHNKLILIMLNMGSYKLRQKQPLIGQLQRLDVLLPILHKGFDSCSQLKFIQKKLFYDLCM